MKMQMFDGATGAAKGEVEVPDDVILAAQKVEHWLLAQGARARIHGLGIIQAAPTHQPQNLIEFDQLITLQALTDIVSTLRDGFSDEQIQAVPELVRQVLDLRLARAYRVLKSAGMAPVLERKPCSG